jgi:DNA polymerase III delta subunit
LKVGLAGAGGNALANAIRAQGAAGYLAWKIPAYRSFAKAWPRARVQRALDECLRTDRLLKSGGLEERALVEELVLRLVAWTGKPAAVAS